MADADLKPHPTRPRIRDSIGVTLRDLPDYGEAIPPAPFMPWMQIADLWLKHAGFSPGKRMRIAFDFRNHCLSISPEFE